MPFPTALAMLQAHLDQLSTAAASIVVADYERAPEADVLAVLARARNLVASSLEALDIVDVLYVDLPAAEVAEDGESSVDWDDRPSTPPIVADAIEDVLVLARMGLHSRARLLTGVAASGSTLERLSVIGSALRTIQKSLSAVDRALSRSEAVTPTVLFHERALHRSLEVRKRYYELATFVLRGGAPSEDGVRDRLLSASAAISRTLGLPIAVHLRTDDRALLMTTRARAREWLMREEEPDHLAAGVRLWQDIAGAVTMFLEVNRREELLQHDARLVRDALPEVPRGGHLWAPEKRANVLHRLAAMRGRSSSLDALLDLPPSAVSPRELRAILEDLDHSLAAVTLLDQA